MGSKRWATVGLVGLIASASAQQPPLTAVQKDGESKLDDRSDGADWAGYGRSYGEQHFSPLKRIDDRNVSRLGLAWSIDLGPGNSVSTPLAIDGILYFTTGYSVIHAVDAATGKSLWTYDSKAAEKSGFRLRQGWGSRGIGWSRGKIYAGTHDGRLIALDARSGKLLWSAQTFAADEPRYITGAPRAFRDMVIIGHGGADVGAIRGYVSAYDADTGALRWRWYTVPGNPADGFENEAMAAAARTWTGEWWKMGGGGTVWNAMSYDRETDTVLLGTGNGSPWNQKLRSPGGGDNLYLCSIVALDAKTGRYKWHYQVNPGESWDYNAAMDIALADLTIDGKPRKVLITAPKNGFLYVIDRINGRLISAKPYAKVTWASHIDVATGRPVENPDARFGDGKTFELWPSPMGSHSWQAMAFSPVTHLVYIPTAEKGALYRDLPPEKQQNWASDVPLMGALAGLIMEMDYKAADPRSGSTALIAWDPVAQKEIWRQPGPSGVPGSTMATAGNLLFQGTLDGRFRAFAADSGKPLWSFATQAPAIAAPITYSVAGRQYVTILTGGGLSVGITGEALAKYGIDYREQKRRVLTFALGGRKTLPAAHPFRPTPPDDPSYVADAVAAQRGAIVFATRCAGCHGMQAVAAGSAPDLRTSSVPTSGEALSAVVREGVLSAAGMPPFAEMRDGELADLRQYLRNRAGDLRAKIGK